MSEVSAKSENIFFTKKSACYLWGFWFFFPKIPPIFNLKLEFFPIEKLFADFPNRDKFIYSYLLMTKFSARLIFFFPKSPDFETWSWIFFRLKIFFIFFPNFDTFIYCQLIMCEVSAKSEKFFFTKKSACYLWGFWFFFPKIPPIFNLKLEFFPIEKLFADFPNSDKFIYSYLLMTKFSARLIFFFFQNPPILELEVGFFSI